MQSSLVSPTESIAPESTATPESQPTSYESIIDQMTSDETDAVDFR
jgi:hypothetical protein